MDWSLTRKLSPAAKAAEHDPNCAEPVLLHICVLATRRLYQCGDATLNAEQRFAVNLAADLGRDDGMA